MDNVIWLDGVHMRTDITMAYTVPGTLAVVVMGGGVGGGD